MENKNKCISRRVAQEILRPYYRASEFIYLALILTFDFPEGVTPPLQLYRGLLSARFLRGSGNSFIYLKLVTQKSVIAASVVKS